MRASVLSWWLRGLENIERIKISPKLTLQQNCITHERLLSLREIFLVAFYSNLIWSQRFCLKFFFVKERACRETWNVRNRGTQRRTVFSEISVRRSKYCLEFSITWRRLKISRWQFHSCTILKAFLTNSSRFSEVSFSHFNFQVRLFVVEKRKPKISRFKNMKRGIRKFLTFIIRYISSKIFGKIILKPL